MRLFMKMAGGGNTQNVKPGDLNLEPFVQQANQYATSNEGLQVVWKIVNTLALTHPMHVVRAAEVQVWLQYPRRGQEKTEHRAWRDDMREAGSYYKQEFEEVATHLKNAAKKAASGAREAFEQARRKGGTTP
jgi:hypothetical protein